MNLIWEISRLNRLGPRIDARGCLQFEKWQEQCCSTLAVIQILLQSFTNTSVHLKLIKFLEMRLGRCDIMIYNKNYVYGLCLFFQHRDKTLGMSWVMRNKDIFFYVNEVTFGPQLRMGAGCQRSQPCDKRVGTFSPIPLTSWMGRGAGG